ncbi:MAG: metallophosphoesterase [Magnetococcales bacterium]|nr:metallophosphoesterase [Magnetococcales bacterium]
MSESSTTPAQNFFQKLKATFIRPKTFDEVVLTGEIHLKGDELRIPFTGGAVRLMLGKRRQGRELWICPEFLLDPSLDLQSKTFILIDPKSYFVQPSGFFRLDEGSSMILGRGEKNQQTYFQFPKEVAKRHLTIAHAGDAFIFKDLTEDSGTYIAPLGDNLEEEKIVSQRMSRLLKIREIFGGPIRLLSNKQALETIDQVNTLLENDSSRPLDDRGKPGGLVYPPEGMTPLIVGDLHSQVGNLVKILTENHFLEGLENGTIYLILLGDAVHSEVDGEMDQMESSILMMDFIFKLKIRFPAQVFYLLGNHDSFSKDVSKTGIPQGILWERAIRKVRGEAYKEQFDRLYLNLPYIAKSDQFIVCHAAPPKAKVTEQLLINTYRYPGLVKELVWNRLRRPGYPAGYTKMDVVRLRKNLTVAPETPFIVAHNPLSQDVSVWMDVGGIENHHIVFSSRTNELSLFFRIRDQIVPFIYTVEPKLIELLNAL